VERRLREKLPDGKFLNVSAERSRTMASIKGKHAKSTERKLRMALIRAGLRGWKLHPQGVQGNPDVYFPETKIVVFVDGCFWHGCPRCGHVPHTNSAFWQAKFSRNQERDILNTQTLKRNGMRVVRIWEHSLANTRSTEVAIERIERLLVNSRFGGRVRRAKTAKRSH
jgi:DNA mismatch endonuclease (patch repair protein)